MRAETEGKMGVRLAVEPHFIGRWKRSLVQIGRGPTEGNALARFDGDSIDPGVHRADPTDVGQRHENPEELLARERDPLRILPQIFERFGMLSEIAQSAGDGVDDRVAAARKSEIGEAHHLLTGERPPAVGRLSQGTEEIFPGIRYRTVELRVQIVLQSDAFFQPTRDPEDMDSPADPGFGLGLRHIQKIGEGMRLNRQGEPMNQLDRRAPQRIRQLFPEEGFHLSDHCGLFRTLEKRLDDGAVIGVLWRIGLDRQLPHRADILFRGNRNPEGNIGTEGLPVLGRLPDILMAQQHVDFLPMKRTLKHPGTVARFAERVWQRRSIAGHGCH